MLFRSIAAYAGASFSLEDPGGHPLPLHFTGIRRTGDVIWVSFETQHRDLSGARVCSRMLWEIYPDQVNIVQAKYGGKNRSLLFTPGDGAKRLP